MKKLEIYLDGDKMLELEADEFRILGTKDWEEIRSNPAMFAALAGADPETLASLPGEQVAIMSHGGELTIDWRLRIHYSKPHLGEFRSVGG